jgi:tetratricopeptide (TPR) repeat protein
MYSQSTMNRFIGRTKEIAYFKGWLNDAHAPRTLYFHDAAEEPDRKGGIGKTFLLRYCADLVSDRKDISIVTADFFSVGNRDSIFLAEHVINGLQRLFPDWEPVAFRAALSSFRAKTLSVTEGGAQLQRLLVSELMQDLQRLKARFHEPKTLLVFLDTFETIEQNPELVVLQPGRAFPDTYHIPIIRFVIAGRNRLDAEHPNWQHGRLAEVVSVPVEPFDRQEMMDYVEEKSISVIPTEEQQISALYKYTEGRPILIGLAIDVLNHRILTLETLLTVRPADFEQYLVEQINYLENPLNWVTLFMAHVYHRFNLDMLEHILKQIEFAELIPEISREALVKTLPQLSFIRQSGSGESFVLHDEMQRLVTRYCWPKHDVDLRVRKAISRCMIEYYEQELQRITREQEQQVATIELLYHKLYFNLDEGVAFFQSRIQRAMGLWQLIFARLLLLEAGKFSPHMSLAQLNTLQFSQAQLLRREENPTSIDVIENLEKNADPQWMEQNKVTFLLEAGRCYFERSMLKEARSYFSHALDAVQYDERTKAYILSYLGGACRKQGQLAEAIRFFEQGTAIMKALGDRSNYANMLSTIGSIMAQQGKYEEAMRRCKIALQIREEAFARKEASELPIAGGLTTLGVIYLNSGNVLEAEAYFKRAFDIYSRLNNKSGIATIYNHFGHVELYRGNMEEARRWFLKGEQDAMAIDVEQYTNSLNKLGRICLAQNQLPQALSYLQRAIASAQQVPDYFQLTESLIDLARVRAQMQQEDEATSLLQQAEEIARREQYENSYAAIELIRAETALRRQCYDEAFRHLEQYCYHMLLHNTNDYSVAVRKLTDVLLTIPATEQSAIIQQVVASWTARGLADRYPELIDACQEVQEWSME